ncbi:MAG: nucleotide exchange factor GrpE [bacterium]|nr:nucleotide exchange factor GrpE [bacterium]
MAEQISNEGSNIENKEEKVEVKNTDNANSKSVESDVKEEIEIDYKYKYLRLLAEHDNFMKSVERRLEYEKKMYKAKTLAYILNLKDMLDTYKDNNAFVDMLKSEVNKILEIEKIECLNTLENEIFDSYKHEVVGFVETLDKSLENKVAKVLKQGYVYSDVLIRPTYVMLYRLKAKGGQYGGDSRD